jgi:hypothetical protein
MKRIVDLLYRGEYYFGTGSHTTPEFDSFFDMFKVSFTNELKKIKAKDIEFSKGHFYLSGFFRIGEQLIYFSISDVRHGLGFRAGRPEMLVRTAQHNRDFTGGANTYVFIEPNMSKEIARKFGMPELYTPPAKRRSESVSEIAEKGMKSIAETGMFERSVPSMKQANFIAWEIGEKLGHGNFSITESKIGRTKIKAFVRLEGFSYKYEAGSKKLTIIANRTDEQLINSLEVKEEGEVVKNMFDPEQKCFLEPLAVALHDYIKGAEFLEEWDNMQQALSIFRQKYPEEYMILLD